MDIATQTHLKALRNALMFRLQELRSELQASAQTRLAAPVADAHEVTDLKDLAGEQASAGIVEQAERRDLDEARLVEAALQRLDQGRYGDCEDCGEPIAWQRLQVQPAAPRCADCQAAIEQAELHHRR